MKKSQTLRLSEIPLAAKKIAPLLSGGEIIALIGQLGSGKTTFAKALGKALGVKRTITSPTFILMNRYRARAGKKTVWLYHLDLYRANSWKEIAALGLKEIWQKPDSLVVIEWADKIKRRLPKKTKYIYFK